MVFVLDRHKKPLMPCSEKRARQLLERGRAVVYKKQPFTIRLKDRIVEESKLQPLRLKLDPGSKVTGVAILEEGKDSNKAIWLGEIYHKQGIKNKLDTRRSLRRNRRNRKTRYRQPRFLNRQPGKCAACGKNAQHGRRYCRSCKQAENLVDNGYRETRLPPSLRARVNQTLNAVDKLIMSLPITDISIEHAKFDTQLMQNPDISGIEYQQGELAGYEVREYLLEKWKRRCAYCGKENVPLEIEHIIPRSRGGTNRISNLAIACHECNQKKNNLTAEEFGHPEIQKRAKLPLRDAAMMNATRWVLYNKLKESGKPVECGTGARTKKQRIEHKLPKTHYYDACCIGASTPADITIAAKYVSIWSAVGRGSRRMRNTDKYGFPRSHRTNQKQRFGFQTGDIVSANIPCGKYKGSFMGRVAIRSSGYFDIKDGTSKCICQGISWRYMHIIQRNLGWEYEKKGVAS